jgi:hypothetical protein
MDTIEQFCFGELYFTSLVIKGGQSIHSASPFLADLLIRLAAPFFTALIYKCKASRLVCKRLSQFRFPDSAGHVSNRSFLREMTTKALRMGVSVGTV